MSERDGAEPRVIVEAQEIAFSREIQIRYHEQVAVAIYHHSPELPDNHSFFERKAGKLRKIFVERRKAAIRRKMAEFERNYHH